VFKIKIHHHQRFAQANPFHPRAKPSETPLCNSLNTIHFQKKLGVAQYKKSANTSVLRKQTRLIRVLKIKPISLMSKSNLK